MPEPLIEHAGVCTLLHSTIRFSIDNKVNILSPTHKINQTCLFLKYHHSRLVSISNIYMLYNTYSILTLTYYEQPCFIMLTVLKRGPRGKISSVYTWYRNLSDKPSQFKRTVIHLFIEYTKTICQSRLMTNDVILALI